MSDNLSDTNNQFTDSRPLLFISHRHADKKIADVLSSFVSNRSAGSVEVHQSSSSTAEAPQLGENLRQQLMKYLYKAGVVVMLYTTPDHDWSYCMWECGVALHPESPATRVLLFECAVRSPGPFIDQVRVDARNLVDIQKFTNFFLTQKDFFPGAEKPVTYFHENEPEVIRAAQQLYDELNKVLPPVDENPVEEWPAWPFLQLELSLEKVQLILHTKPEERLQLATNVIQQECLISEADKVAQQLFGILEFSEGMRFQELINIWKNNSSSSQSKWIESLCFQIMKGAIWQFPKLKWELMTGVDNETWYAPVLNRVRKIPSRSCMQFDIYFYKFDVEADGKSVKVSIPGQ